MAGMEFAAPAPVTLDEAVADVASRFLTPLAPSETATINRLFGHIQQAHWFYVDEVVPASGGALPKLSSWDFCEVLFRVCPMLEPYRSRSADFLAQYKAHLHTVPVYGAILLSRDCKQVLLVRGAGSRSWGFPRGKVNEGESGVACAAREVVEETGYDCRAALAWTGAPGGGGGLLPHTLQPPHLHVKEGSKTVTMYVAVGVPNDGSVAFRPQTKCEIEEIGWFGVAGLFMLAGIAVPGAESPAVSKSRIQAVLPFLPSLHAVLVKHGRWPKGGGGGGAAGAGGGLAGAAKPGPGSPYVGSPAVPAPPTAGAAAGAGAGGATGKKSKKPIPTAPYVAPAAPVGGATKVGTAGGGGGAGGGGKGKGKGAAVTAVPPPVPLPLAPEHLVAPLDAGGGTGGGGATGWSVQDMWATNAALLQKRFVYDGNPHTFGDAAVAAVPLVGLGSIARAAAVPLAPPAAAPLPPARPPAGGAPGTKGTVPAAGKRHKPVAGPPASAAARLPPPPDATFASLAAPFRFDMDAILAAMALSACPAATASGSAGKLPPPAASG